MIEKRKVLVTTPIHESFISGMEKSGFAVDYMPGISNREVLKIIDRYFGIVVSTNIRVDKTLIDAGRLKFIGRAGSGMENIDEQYADSRGIRCISSPEGNRDAVGEHVVGMLLSLLHNIAKADREVRSGLWQREENRGLELRGRTFGILGYGNTGSAVARNLEGFEVGVLAYDKYKSGFGTARVVESTLEDIFRKADILSIHVPLTAETRGWVNMDFFRRFSNSIYVVNSSRGGIVKTADLIRALEAGMVRGAALDVFENENPATFNEGEKELMDYLARSPRVVLSPHIAGWTMESHEKIASILLEKIRSTIRQATS